jgi:hypothetical protein
MKKSLLFLFLIIFFQGMNFPQTYPLVTIEEIQYAPDSILIQGDPPSSLNGDTVRVRGIVMVRPVVDPDTDRRPIMWAGARWQTYLHDPDGTMYENFDGIVILQNDTTAPFHGTFFDLIDTAMVVEFRAVIEEFFTTTQCSLLIFPVTPVEIISQLPARPAPVVLEISDFMDGGVLNPLAEQYEGMYVTISNVITSDRNTGNGTFRINDGNGNHMFMYDQSGYFTLRGHRLTGLTTYQPPNDGSTLDYIRGVIQTRTDGYYITPMYPGDIGPVLATPPTITSVRRNPVEIMTNQSVQVTANIQDPDGSVDSARIYYRVDNGSYTPVNMTFVSGTQYSGTIPGINSDSALVDYYIWAKDNDGNTSTFPSPGNVQFFYLVLNRNIMIQDVQYNPFGTDISGYMNYYVSVTGLVTADTSDFHATNTGALNRVCIQNGVGPWSGIQIGFRGSNGGLVRALQKGQMVTVNGVVLDGPADPAFSVTRIDSVTSVVVHSSGNPLPAPQILLTGDMGTGGNGQVDREKWESVLVRYEDITVTNSNPDLPSNFDEIYVNDGSGNTRVELGDGEHNYSNFDPNLILVQNGNTFDAINGIMYFSFSNYKLVPRNEDDFEGFNPVNVEEEEGIPSSFSLTQNFPNPFNPSTKINYSLPAASVVSLKIYNLLGQEVKTLVNNENQPAGNYTLTFDAFNLPSGIYFYRLAADSFVEVKKMILLK